MLRPKTTRILPKKHNKNNKPNAELQYWQRSSQQIVQQQKVQGIHDQIQQIQQIQGQQCKTQQIEINKVTQQLDQEIVSQINNRQGNNSKIKKHPQLKIKKKLLVEIILRNQLIKMGYTQKNINKYVKETLQLSDQYEQVNHEDIRDWVLKTKNQIIDNMYSQQQKIINIHELNTKQNIFKKNKVNNSVENTENNRQIQSKHSSSYQSSLHRQQQQKANQQYLPSQIQHRISEEEDRQNHEVNRRLQIQDFSHRRDFHNDNIDNVRQCQICYLESSYFLFQKLQCGHIYCKNCIRLLLISNNDSGIFLVQCPDYNCQHIITETEAKVVLKRQALQRFLKFKMKTELQLNPKNKFCTQPNCEEILVSIPDRQQLKCNKCDIMYCKLCFALAHSGKQCSNLLLNVYQRHNIKKCPKCQSPIQKTFGCNHMTCQKCRTQFCWLCLQETNSYHYRIYNCFGCPGMMFEDDASIIYCRRVLQILFFLFLPVMVAIFVGSVLLIYPFYLLFAFFDKISKWIQEEDNPKIELMLVMKIFHCENGCATTFKIIFAFILFIPRSVLYCVFIAPIKYCAGIGTIICQMT